MQFLKYPQDPDLKEYEEVLTWPPHEFYDWLDNLGIIHYKVNCENCDHPYTLNTDASRKEGARLRCKHCKKWRSLKKNSAFDGTKEDLKFFLHVAILWKNNYKQKQVMEQTGGTKKQVELATAKIRAAIRKFFATNPVRFDNEHGKVYEIDEAKLVPWRMRRTTERKRLSQKEQRRWVFGIMQRKTRLVWIQPVPRRSRVQLEPIIKEHIPQGATICSDEWKAYSNLNDTGYCHYTVNH